MSYSASAGTATKFRRENYFPLQWNGATEEICLLYPNRYGYIYKPLTEGGWLSADEKWKLSDSLILKAIACAHPKFFIGARPGKATRFAVLDIDNNSKYHTLDSFKKIKQVLATAGISALVPYRSSVSGGWHLYIFFDSPISSRDLHKQLTNLFQLNDFKIQKGQLEIFPNPGQSNTLGFGLRLPLQPGWAWLDLETMQVETKRSDLTAFEALDLFIFDLNTATNSRHHFHQLKRYVEDRLLAQQQSLLSATAIKNKVDSRNPNSLSSLLHQQNTYFDPAVKEKRKTPVQPSHSGSNASDGFFENENKNLAAPQLANIVYLPSVVELNQSSCTMESELRKTSPSSSPETLELVHQSFKKLPPGINPNDWLKGRGYLTTGLTATGQRADAIFCLSHYFFYGDPENGIEALGYGYEQERHLLIEETLSDKHNGKSKDLNRGVKDAFDQVRRAANWRPATRQVELSSAYSKEVPISWTLENLRRQHSARARIETAVISLRESGAKITPTAIQTLTKCSWETLYKHSDLWKLTTDHTASEPKETSKFQAGPSLSCDLQNDSFTDLFLQHETPLTPDLHLNPSAPPAVTTESAKLQNSLALVSPQISTDEYNDLLLSSFITLSAADRGGGTTVAPPLFSELGPRAELLRLRTVGCFKLRKNYGSLYLRRSKRQSFRRILLSFLNLVWFLPLFTFCFLNDPILRPWSTRYLASRRKLRKSSLVTLHPPSLDPP